VIERLQADSAAEDFEALAAIQSSLAIAHQLLAAGIRESDSGFLISAYKPSDFRDFIRRDGILLAARDEADGPPVGYLLGNSGQTFLANHPTTQLLWDGDEQRAQYGPAYASGRFAYLDQIGVVQSRHGTGVAQALHLHFLGLVGRPILAAVVQEPLRNARSTTFFKKLGYVQIGMFHTAEFKGLRDVRSAVLALPEGKPPR
jgi:GNAT superfamily N-acetyltransferase